jgi:hypothetical protein
MAPGARSIYLPRLQQLSNSMYTRAAQPESDSNPDSGRSSMTLERQRRMLLRHGFIFLFLGPCFGLAIVVLPHPRAWLAAHLAALLSCFILATIGLVWRELRLTDRQRRTAFVAGFIAAYAGLAGNIFSAIVNLPGPASQPGVQAPMPQGAIFLALLAVVVPATFISFGLVLFGMRGAD